MSKPEISRRCPSCGGSIRERVFFCSQCGRPTGHVTSELKRTAPDGKKDSTAAETVTLKESQPDAPATEETKEPTPVPSAPEGAVARNAPQIARGGFNRARAVARNAVEDDVLPRVEKLRQISSVVIDEASYDPSLRFVLVAAVLFIVFLVILLLSELIT